MGQTPWLEHFHQVYKCLGQGPSLRLVCLPLLCQGDTAHNAHAVLPALSALELTEGGPTRGFRNPCFSQWGALLILVYYQFHYLMLTFHRKVKFITHLRKKGYCDHPHLCLLFKNIYLIYLYTQSASVCSIPVMCWESKEILILTIRKVNLWWCTERNQI